MSNKDIEDVRNSINELEIKIEELEKEHIDSFNKVLLNTYKNLLLYYIKLKAKIVEEHFPKK